MRAAFTRHINHSRGANFAKELEALARGAFAELKALDQVVHGQRAAGNEERPVDFGQRARLAEAAKAARRSQ
jgi:hypothetical protein